MLLWTVSFVLLLPFLVSAQEISVRRQINASLELTCTLPLESDVISSIIWKRTQESSSDVVWAAFNETEVTVDDPERYSMGPEYETLQIMDAQIEDSGLYSCEILVVKSASNMTDALITKQWDVTIYDVPSPPLALAIDSVGSFEVAVSWVSSENDNNSPITGYIMTASSLDDHTDIDKARTSNHNATTLTISDLSPFTNYTISGVALNEAGASEPSSSIEVATMQAAPSQKPRFEHVLAESTSLLLKFHAPPSDTHNGPLIGYLFTTELELKSTRVLVHNETINDPHLTEHNISELQPAQRYVVNISVFNAAGYGPPYDLVLSTDEGVPSHPTIVGSRSKTWDTLRVVWQAPDKTNGLLRGYYVRWREHNKNFTERAEVTKTLSEAMHTHTITKLKPCTMYHVYITAFTSKGEGSHEKPAQIYTEVKAASPPSITYLEKANDSLSVQIEWEPGLPSNPGIRCRIQQYVINFTASDPNDNRVATVPATYRKYVLTNLTTTNYSVTVRGDIMRIHHSVVLEGLPSEPRTIQLNSEQGARSVTAGIIAGIVVTIIVLILIIVVVLFVRSWIKYVNNRRSYTHDQAESVHLTSHSVSFPQYANNLPKTQKNPEQAERTAISTSKWQQHVAKLHADDDFGFSEEYQSLDCGPSDHFSVSASIDSDNKSKNRYINILAYDHSRVCLRSLPGKPCSDYINANYVDGYHKPKAYIATQGPLPNTFGDFWRLVWEQNSSIIVMITNLTEKGKRKCDQYWPKDEEQQVTYEQMQVKLLNTYQMAHYTVRVFSLRNLKLKKKLGSSERVVLQYHYTDWPDHGVPDYTLPTLTFIRKSVAAHSEAQGTGPIIIHCSAGVGRTGTFIVIDSMIKQMQDVKTINVFGFLSHIRNQRNQLVQTEDQYIFIHDALLEFILSGNTEVKDNTFGRYIEDLLQEKDGCTVIESQYKLVTQFRPKDYHTAAGLLAVNLPKNRQGALLPVDLARVRLPTRPGEEGSDYINASFLQGYNKNEEFIATQFPLSSTVEDFWRMVWEHNSMTIVLFNPPEPDEEEFPVFWPSQGNDFDFGHFRVSVVEESTDDQLVTKDFILQSTQDDYECTTRIFSTSSWPDGCEPLSQAFDLVETIQKWHTQHEVDMEGPVIVVDRIGGTHAAMFCALTAAYDQRQHEGSIDVYATAKLYHLKRPGVWPKQDDYFMLYRAVESLCSEGSVGSERDSGIGNCKDHYSATVPAVRHSILKTINRAVSRNSELTL